MSLTRGVETKRFVEKTDTKKPTARREKPFDSDAGSVGEY